MHNIVITLVYLYAYCMNTRSYSSLVVYERTMVGDKHLEVLHVVLETLQG